MRSTALSGIVLRLNEVPWPMFGSAYGAGVTRRPFRRTRVATEPRPRSEAVWLPRWKPLPPPKSWALPPAMAGISRSSSATLVAPLRSICSRVITWTTDGGSVSVRLMFEPVTSMRSLLCACAKRRPPWRGTGLRSLPAPQ